MVAARLKHLLYAVCLLVLLCALTEVGLRVYDSSTGQITRPKLYDRGYICKSWFTHHSLRPSQSFAVKNPDTNAKLKLSINSFGLRGPEPALPKPNRVFRVLCLGDDTTFAPYLPDEETFCARLQAKLQGETNLKVEVLNGGLPDSCPLLAYLQFKHHWMALQPDLVILHFDMTDVADDYHFRRLTVMGRGGEPLNCPHPDLDLPKSMASTSGAPQNFEQAFLLPEFVKRQARSIFADKAFSDNPRDITSLQGKYEWLRDDPDDWSLHITQCLKSLSALDRLVRDTGAEFVVATYPAPWQVSDSASNGEGVREKAGVGQQDLFESDRPFKTLAEYSAKHDLLFCDTSKAFFDHETPESLFFVHAPTFSADGHQLYAEELAHFVVKQHLLEPHSPNTSPRSRPIQEASLPRQMKSIEPPEE